MTAQMEHPTIHGHLVIGRVKSVKHDNADVVLVDRREGYERFVTGIVNSDDSNPLEWFWGHYFNDEQEAREDFISR